MDAMMQKVLELCPQVGEGESGQEAVGRAIEFAAKWFTDLDGAFAARKDGAVGALIPAEVLAYGALQAMFLSLPEDDIRRRLFIAGDPIGDFIRQRWEVNARRQALKDRQPS